MIALKPTRFFVLLAILWGVMLGIGFNCSHHPRQNVTQYSEETIIANTARINKHEFIKFRLTKLIPDNSSIANCPFRPSPFAGTRYIDFKMVEKDSLQISLLDMLGNPLANILGYNLEAGCYSLYFEEANVNSINYKIYFDFISGKQENFVKTITFSPGAKIN